ncbi:MAG: LuxR C-terminal-related transcriptional regulator, partial [Herbiconiux sp.]|nr:LuxR C-terminal-related transcriptional regulator [Herbiconiux sp.]
APGALARGRSPRGRDGPAAGDVEALAGLEATLTERELQVLGLLARGHSNRQIAQALFISAKTASVHVSNILRKTDTTTRTEAAFLARSFPSA